MKAGKAVYTKVGSDEAVYEYEFPRSLGSVVRSVARETNSTSMLADADALADLAFIYLADAMGTPIADIDLTKKLKASEVRKVRLNWDFELILDTEEDAGEGSEVAENPTATTPASS